MLSSELENCLNQAFAQAREARHEFLTVEHLLLAMLDTPRVREVLEGCGARARRGWPTSCASTSTTTTPRCWPRATSARCSRRWASSACCSARCSTCSPSGKKEVGVVNVLVAIFSEKQSHAVFLLARHERHAPGRRAITSRTACAQVRREQARGRGRPRPRPSARARAAARSRSTPPTSTRRRRTAASIR